MIDLAPSDEQMAFARSLELVVERNAAVEQPETNDALWRGLAEVGFLGLCSAGVGGTALDAVTGMEALGARCCPGPVVAAVAGSNVLTGDELDAVLAGEQRVTLTDGRHVPWGDECELVVELAADGAWLVELEDAVPVATLSGEPWVIARQRRVRRLGESGPAVELAELVRAAYLLGAATSVVQRAAGHARERVQFRRPIGDFQAVAHPLARSQAEVRACLELVRLMARDVASGSASAQAAGAEAARAARVAGDRVHQVFGAVGFALETGVAAMTMRIRQWSVLPLRSSVDDVVS